MASTAVQAAAFNAGSGNTRSAATGGEGSSIIDRIMGYNEETRRMLMYGPPNRKDTQRPEDEYAADLRTESFIMDYEGPNSVMRTVITENIKQSTLFPTRLLLPQKPMPPTGWEEYQQMIFDQHTLDQVPELGVPRFVTSHFRSFKVKYQRSGLGFTMDATAALTRTGVMMYTMHMLQIANAVQNQMTLNVYFRLLETAERSNNKSWAVLFGLRDPHVQLRALFDHAFDMWGILNKTEHGWRRLISFIGNVFSMRGIEPDTLVLPGNTRALLSVMRPEFQKYSETGELTVQNLRSFNGFVFSADGLDIFEAASYKMGEHSEIAQDPLVQERMIGEHMVSKMKFHEHCATDKYQSCLRRVSVYDNLSKGFVPISLLEQLRYSGLFDVNTGEVTDHFGRAFFGDSNLLAYLNDAQVDATRKVVEGIKKLDADGKTAWTDVQTQCKADNDIKKDTFASFPGTGSKKNAPSHNTGPRGKFGSAAAAWDNPENDSDDGPLHTSQVPITVSNQSQPVLVTLFHPALPPIDEKDAAAFKAATDDNASNKPMRDVLRNYDVKKGFTWLQLKVLAEQTDLIPDNELDQHPFIRIGKREMAKTASGDSNNLVNQIRAYHTAAESGEANAKTVVENLLRKLYCRCECSHSIHTLSFFRFFTKSDQHSNTFKYLNDRIPSFWDATMEYVKTDQKSYAQLYDVAKALNQYLIAKRQTQSKDSQPSSAKVGTYASRYLDPVDALLQEMARGPSAGTSTAMGTFLGALSDAKLPGEIDNVTIQICKGTAVAADDTGYPTVKAARDVFSSTDRGVAALTKGKELASDDTIVEALNKMRVHLRFFLFLEKYNIHFPIDFSMRRPFMLYYMASAIAMVRGLATGSCSFGHANMMMGGDVIRKVMMGNFTCRQGAVVHTPDNVLVVPNVLCKGYIRGGGVKMFDPLNPSDVRRFRQGDRSFKDMFVIPMKPREWNAEFEDVSDITGFFPTNIGLPLEQPQKRAHYNVHSTFNNHWGKLEYGTSYFWRDHFDPEGGPRGLNTVTAQATQYSPGYGVGGQIEERKCVVRGKNHWGPNVYENVTRDRQGEGLMYVKTVDFSHNLVLG